MPPAHGPGTHLPKVNSHCSFPRERSGTTSRSSIGSGSAGAAGWHGGSPGGGRTSAGSGRERERSGREPRTRPPATSEGTPHPPGQRSVAAEPPEPGWAQPRSPHTRAPRHRLTAPPPAPSPPAPGHRPRAAAAPPARCSRGSGAAPARRRARPCPERPPPAREGMGGTAPSPRAAGLRLTSLAAAEKVLCSCRQASPRPGRGGGGARGGTPRPRAVGEKGRCRPGDGEVMGSSPAAGDSGLPWGWWVQPH